MELTPESRNHKYFFGLDILKFRKYICTQDYEKHNKK